MFQYSMTALLGSIVVLGLGVTHYENSGDPFWMYVGAVGFVVCVLSLILSGAMPEEGTFLHDVVLRKPTQEDYDALYKTGYEPEEIEAERRAYNDAYRSMSLWAGGQMETYVDYDGNKRDAKTNEVI